MLLVAAAAVPLVKVEVVCASSAPPLAPAAGCGVAEVVLAGEQTMGGGLHSTLCPPPSLPHRHKQGGFRRADGGAASRGGAMEQRGAENRRGRAPPLVGL